MIALEIRAEEFEAYWIGRNTALLMHDGAELRESYVIVLHEVAPFDTSQSVPKRTGRQVHANITHISDPQAASLRIVSIKQYDLVDTRETYEFKC